MTSWNLIEFVLYVGQGLLWSAGGFVVGVLFVRQKQKVDQVSNDLERIKEIVVNENAVEEDVPDDRPKEAPIVPREGRRALGVALIVLALITVGQGWYFTDKNAEITACQQRQAKAFQEATVARGTVAEQDRQVLDTMVISIAKARTAQAAGDALSKYIAARAKNDSERAKNPLPAIDACGVKG